MRILYVARHGQRRSNDDEGAIAYALEKLGHSVRCVGEESEPSVLFRGGYDLALFHKWSDFGSIRRLSGRAPVVFWYFDLVDFPDPVLAHRCAVRKQWMESVLPHVALGFCTDGDWAANDRTGKLVHLTQGFDERLYRPGAYHGSPTSGIAPTGAVLFTGVSKGGGSGRESFVREMRDRYPDCFHHYPRGLHGEALRAEVTGADVVVAPDAPVTDRYWSNRVYNALGMGGFLLHPYTTGLTAHYSHGGGVVYYEGRQDLHDKIRWYRGALSSSRKGIAELGQRVTMERHTYSHRVEKLLRVVKERLGVG